MSIPIETSPRVAPLAPARPSLAPVYVPPRTIGFGRMLLLGTFAGLLVGVVEAVVVVVMMVTVPGSVSWRSANGPEILFIAPPVNAIAFALLAALVWCGSLVRPASRWDVRFIGLAGALAVYLGATMPGQVLYWWAVLLVTIGGGVFASQIYQSGWGWIHRNLNRLTLGLAGVPLVAAPAVLGGAWWREHHAAQPAFLAAGAPNLLLLVVDTQRADHLGLYHYRRPTSPTLDSLGAGGLVFDQATANSSWTLPSHATMMTGRLQHEHQAGLLKKPFLDTRFPTIAERLAGAGYATGGFVANTFWAGRRTGLDRGFGHYSDYYRNLGDAIARTTIGRTIYYEVLPRFGSGDVPGRRRAPQLNGDVLRWIDGLQGRKFFAFVNYLDVHPPLVPPPSRRGRFSNGGSLPPVHEIDVGAIAGEMAPPPKAELADRLNRYDESILAWDDALADLLRGLEQRGLRENTLIVVTSDHGESFGEHGLFSHGHSLYRDQIEVPLVLSWPARIKAPRRLAGPVGLDQLPATLADAAGLGPGAFPGRSLLQTDPSPGFVVTEVARRSRASLGWPSSAGWVVGILTPRWRYLVREGGKVELYDDADRDERMNVAVEPPTVRLADSLGRVVRSSPIPAGLAGRR